MFLLAAAVSGDFCWKCQKDAKILFFVLSDYVYVRWKIVLEMTSGIRIHVYSLLLLLVTWIILSWYCCSRVTFVCIKKMRSMRNKQYQQSYSLKLQKNKLFYPFHHLIFTQPLVSYFCRFSPSCCNVEFQLV
jgi:hypothetical protein